MLASRGEIKIHEILDKAGLNFKEEYSFNISGSEFLYFSGENRKFIANHSSNDEEIILATLGGICSFLSD